MIRRLTIALAALLVAAVGGVLTFLYAANADARALAELEPSTVLIVAEGIEAGTPVEQIVRSVVSAEIPASAVVPGGVADLSEVAGMLTTVALVPGEQLLEARFALPELVPGEVEVPANLHVLSVRLDRQRVIGGELQPGDTVGVFVSGQVTATDPSTAQGGGQESLTDLVLHKVLVTAVDGSATTTTSETGERVEEPAADSIMVTLALSASDAELLVFGQEFGSVWLSIEGPEVQEDSPGPVTAEEVFQ
ncbi:Flp pilus assembly protein CpaB [Agrococcus sp. KRD186]|uniref:Flp pilus assembly protein CpaB n=1 Tax=Agrococcus sp. KRD186 TaxID=2729730 RepID=UPI0019CF659B|nr:Flp pilus assembly protein CpaB [Agrococcus sp. KRD186]